MNVCLYMISQKFKCNESSFSAQEMTQWLSTEERATGDTETHYSSLNNTNLSRLPRKAREESVELWRPRPGDEQQVGFVGGMSHYRDNRGTGCGRQGQGGVRPR